VPSGELRIARDEVLRAARKCVLSMFTKAELSQANPGELLSLRSTIFAFEQVLPVHTTSDHE
jgi:hypothetical protein